MIRVDDGRLIRPETIERKLGVMLRDKYKDQVAGKVIVPEIRIKDLGLDSLDQIEFIMQIEEAFNIEITDEVAEHLHTIKDVVSMVTKLREKRHA